MQIPKLVVFDVDGTLIDWNGMVSAHTHRMLGHLRAMQIPIALATGRPMALAPSTVDQVGGADWVASGNGSSLLEVSTGRLLRDRSLADDVVTPAITAMRQLLPGVGVAIEIADTIIEEHGFTDRVPEDPVVAPVDDALEVIGAIDGPVRRVIFFHADYDDRLHDLAAIVESLIDHRSQVHFGGLPIVDISPHGDDKAVALQELADHLGVDAADVLAFGDGGNDLKMLQWAGIGVAMGNARPEVQSAADHVTAHVDQLGIAAFLEPLLAPWL